MTLELLGRQLDVFPHLLLPAVTEGVACGFPSAAEGYFDGDFDLIKRLIPNPTSTYIWRAAGESMINARVNDQDLLAVDRVLAPASGRIAIAIIDGEFTLKRLDVRAGVLILRADNPEYPDIVPAEHSEVVIWGIVTWIMHQAPL